LVSSCLLLVLYTFVLFSLFSLNCVLSTVTIVLHCLHLLVDLVLVKFVPVPLVRYRNVPGKNMCCKLRDSCTRLKPSGFFPWKKGRNWHQIGSSGQIESLFRALAHSAESEFCKHV
jgi:hypothetical protein